MRGPINKFWNAEAVETLRRLYARTTNADIGRILGKDERAILAKAFKLGLKKDRDFIRECALKTAFKKGSIPKNKGKKQSEYMTPEAIERTKAFRFKKGDLPHNTKADGVVTIRRDAGTGIQYKYIRIALAKWELLHRKVWKEHHGEIPKGMNIAFKDGNSLNCEIDNLELITKAENMERNSGVLNLPDEMVATYMAAKSRKVDRELKSELLKHPELIELKRLQIQLNRTINEKSRNRAKAQRNEK